MDAAKIWSHQKRASVPTNDDGTKMVFDPAIRGKTNQFILKFKKPG